jgi:Cu2+-exporting ATPase
VSLLTNAMGVEGTASPEAVMSAVEAAGYGASPKGAGAGGGSAARGFAEGYRDPGAETAAAASLGFLIVLLYFSMGHMMWGWPLPAWFDGNHVAMGLVQLLLTTV